MINLEKYSVRPLLNKDYFEVEVPGSKSITNRSLLLAALGQGSCLLRGVLFSDDSRAFLNCLSELGFKLDINEEKKEVLIEGTGGNIPNKKATINVGSAGTAARFLTVFLAFSGGSYTLNASAQMCKRPMEPLINSLRESGVTINCLGEEGHFPFEMISNGINVSQMTSNTDVSSQFASAMLMAAPLLPNGLRVILEGGRVDGAYIKITLNMLSQFGFEFTKNENIIDVKHSEVTNISSYDIEPDVSAAGYFYAMSPICNKSILVKRVHLDSMQGDIKFVKALTDLGCKLTDTDAGIKAEPPKEGCYEGLDINMNDFSDQTMTMAVVAAFATTPTYIHGIEHIRFQESDRLTAILNELTRLGIECKEIDNFDGIYINPGPMHGADIETYEDHRMAMSFSLPGLKIPGINIMNPGCCSKTFENYFDVLDKMCEK